MEKEIKKDPHGNTRKTYRNLSIFYACYLIVLGLFVGKFLDSVFLGLAFVFYVFIVTGTFIIYFRSYKTFDRENKNITNN